MQAFCSDASLDTFTKVICESVVVGGASTCCDGTYTITDDHGAWVMEKPVYKHVSKEMYIFWKKEQGWRFGRSWEDGNKVEYPKKGKLF